LVAVTVNNASANFVALLNASPISSSTLPGRFSFNQQSNYWSVAGLRPPSGADFDLTLYSDPSLSTQLASSSLTSGVDFVVGDHNFSPLGLYYLKVVQYSGSGVYTVEWEDGPDMLTVPGTIGPISWGSTTVAKVWDVQLAAGVSHTFTLTMSSGTANVGIALFRPSGAAYYAGKSAAVASADANGSGQGESFSYTASTSGYHGFVVWSNNAASASFTIRVQ
ncbi:MAG TPA: hypothetical protein DGH68_05400, partial [Bacteroidetes bacterium]|nr:hypothetical protein [Bacteroidota bacterium]